MTCAPCRIKGAELTEQGSTGQSATPVRGAGPRHIGAKQPLLGQGPVRVIGGASCGILFGTPRRAADSHLCSMRLSSHALAATLTRNGERPDAGLQFPSRPEHHVESRVELSHQLVEDTLSKVDVRRRRDAIAAAKREVEELGFSLEEILAFQAEMELKKVFRLRSRSRAKFRNPENPRETWSGQGRRPAWLVRQLEAGKSQDDLRV